MKLCFIPPLHHLSLSLHGDYLFTLAQHAMKDPNYLEYYRIQKQYKIVDCGAAEGETVTGDALLDVAREMKVNEVVIPDSLYQGWKTTDMYKSFVGSLSKAELRKYSFMVVPQGRTRAQYMRCLNNMLKHDIVPEKLVVGVSKFSAPISFGNRVLAARTIATKTKKPMHLLGTTNNIAEVEQLKNNEFVRSNDSCVSILLASQNQSVDESNYHSIPRPITTNEYFNKRLDLEQIKTAIDNMDFLKRLAKK